MGIEIGSQATKLPRWAYTVVRTRRRQPHLSVATVTRIALDTLQETIISRLRGGDGGGDFPPEGAQIEPYSETQARFWLNNMKLDSPPGPSFAFAAKEEGWHPSRFGVRVAQGAVDVRAWEAYYSPKLWNSAEARIASLEPDLDGTTRESEVSWCGWPDGGVGVQAWWRGWEPEVGSEEEIAFLDAVAVKVAGKETETEMDAGCC